MGDGTSELRPIIKPPHPFVALCTHHINVVIQQKGGTIVRGRVKWFRAGWLKVEKVEITGINRQVNLPWTLIEHQSIAHIHPDVNASERDLRIGSVVTCLGSEQQMTVHAIDHVKKTVVCQWFDGDGLNQDYFSFFALRVAE